MSSVLVITAGLRQPSSSRLLADRLAAATEQALPGTRIEVVELREYARDLTNQLLTGFPSGRLSELLDRTRSADALIAVSPIFSGSYSGLFKTFFDVLEPGSLTGKPVLIAATGGTARHSLVLDHALRPLFSYLQAVVVPTGVYAAPEDWGAGDELAPRIERASGQLAALLGGPARPAADPFEDVIDFESLLGRGSGPGTLT
jgi:FMN reductase